MTRDVTLYIHDIIENMHDAQRFVKDMTFEEFRTNKMAINAVLRSIEVIGEAVKSVPEEIRNRKPSVPWRNMARMRDRVIHMYFGVDYLRVWETVQDAITPILPELESLLDELRTFEKT